MHMLSERDLNSAELDTVQVSKNPTTVVTANGEMQNNEEATVYVNELNLFVKLSSSKIRQQSSRLEISAKITDIHVSRPVVNYHTSRKMAARYSVVRNITCHSSSRGWRLVRQALPHPRLQHHSRRTL